MSEDTKTFCRDGAPFTARFRATDDTWVVRNQIGGEVVTVKDPDIAVAIAECLNFVLEREK